MNDQELKKYIADSLASGRSKEELYAALLGQGYSVDVIGRAFASITAEKSSEQTSVAVQKQTVRVIVLVGAVLIGAGVFSFIAANWQNMSRPMKVIVILLGMLAAYSLGWYLREKKGLTYSGNALILLGSLIFGAGIFLVGQMFNMRQNWPDGFILWMFGAVATGMALRLRPLLYLGFIVGLVSIVSHPFELFMFLFTGFDRFLMTSTLMLMLATAVTFLTAWKIQNEIPPEERGSL